MYNKVLVMEIKDTYAIGITDEGYFIRFCLKPSLNIGDKIFVLDEDIYSPVRNTKTFNFSYNLQHAAGIVAMLALCLILGLMATMGDPVYARADFGSDLILELDKNGNILSAASENAGIPNAKLAKLRGKNIFEVRDDVMSLTNGKGMNLTFHSGEASREKSEFADKMNQTYPGKESESPASTKNNSTANPKPVADDPGQGTTPSQKTSSGDSIGKTKDPGSHRSQNSSNTPPQNTNQNPRPHDDDMEDRQEEHRESYEDQQEEYREQQEEYQERQEEYRERQEEYQERQEEYQEEYQERQEEYREQQEEYQERQEEHDDHHEEADD